ncbi:MAG TPA: hypothetical protein VK879_22850 [Candidatus Sulfomarinibacteraceae bacterium]|nr:hypothetical protein [Candidatus Sulfomarinibacteraceae bacterium]
MVWAQAQNGISEPQAGDTLSGVVVISGTASDDAFLRYELAFRNNADWIVFAEGERPVVGGTLAIWDTTVGQPQNPVFPDGSYELRLRIVRQDHNYDEYFVQNLVLSNSETPTPTPSPTPTTAGTAPGPAATTPAPGQATESGIEVGRPTALPTLTPFPTPSRAVIAGSADNGGGPPAPSAVGAESGEGLLQRVMSIDSGQFSRAFWAGARIGLYLIALAPLYMVIRWLGRRLWRFFLTTFWR